MLGFLVCDNLYQDMLTAVQAQGFKDVHVKRFPAGCGHPPVAWEEVIPAQPEELPQVIFGSHCISTLSASPSPVKQSQLCHVQQCFYLFCPKTLVDSLQQQGAYLLSPGWLANWTGHMDQWGFDRKTAIQFFKDCVKKLLLLDTGTDKKSLDHLREFATFLDKPWDVIPIGLEYLEMLLAKQRRQYLYQEAVGARQKAEKLAADHALVQDVLRLLPEAVEEEKVVTATQDLFAMLMAPKSTAYIPITNSRLQFERVTRLQPGDIRIINDFYRDETKDYLVTADGHSLYLKIKSRNEVVGMVIIEHLSFPEYMSHYLNIALNITGVFGLAIEHVRTIDKLMDASLVAGKVELATEMLHNVGNVLNSVNISAEQIKQILSTSATAKIAAISDLFQTHSNDLTHFFSEDPRGRKLPRYFEKLSEKIDMERHLLIKETDSQLGKIKIIAAIIGTQQGISVNSSIMAKVDPSSLLEEIIAILIPRIKKHKVDIIREYQIIAPFSSQRSKLLQVFLNLMGNALDALKFSEQSPRQLLLKIYKKKPERVAIEIIDNGIGMDEEVLSKIFNYGFSTKKQGHGFGLHNAANYATQLSGDLTAKSQGINCGSSFLLILPLKGLSPKTAGSILKANLEGK